MGRLLHGPLWDSRQSCVALWPLSSHVSFPPVRAWPYHHLPGNRRRCSAPFWLKTTLFTGYPLGFYYLFFETWPLKSCAEILSFSTRGIIPDVSSSGLQTWQIRLPWSFLRSSLRAWLIKNPPTMQETLVRFLGRQHLLEKEQATHSSILGFPWWLCWWRICLQCGRPPFNPWVGKIPWRRERLPTPVFWPGEFHGLYSSWGCKESDMTEQLSEFF